MTMVRTALMAMLTLISIHFPIILEARQDSTRLTISSFLSRFTGSLKCGFNEESR